ncbi:MAG: hypothetical protein MRY83_22645, partial [Flavobacteriales bacterium]|nr:hypothetical protein [Flavobacteriales bacterium]
MKSLILGIALILVGLSPTYSQNDSLSVEDSAKTKNSLIGFPFAFFTPETKWGGGAGALYAFRFKGEPPNSKPSQIQLGFAYTQLKQLLVYFPFQLFVEDAKYFVYGELGYFIYNFNYYGIG